MGVGVGVVCWVISMRVGVWVWLGWGPGGVRRPLDGVCHSNLGGRGERGGGGALCVCVGACPRGGAGWGRGGAGIRVEGSTLASGWVGRLACGGSTDAVLFLVPAGCELCAWQCIVCCVLLTCSIWLPMCKSYKVLAGM